MDEREFWNLKFSVEASTLYHDWRRSALWAAVRWVRIITLAGAVIALVTAYGAPAHLSQIGQSVIALSSILIAVVSLLDLVENFSGGAQKHEELYRRFKHLQADIQRFGSDVSDKQIAEWLSAAQMIRVDEPPTLWAIYAKCWNQIIDRYSIERAGYYRKVVWWRSAIGWLVHFNPQDFPPVPNKIA